MGMLCEKAQLIFAVMKTRDTEAKKQIKQMQNQKQRNNTHPPTHTHKKKIQTKAPQPAKSSMLKEQCGYGAT